MRIWTALRSPIPTPFSTSLDNSNKPLLFYQFLGSHSLLIGLLPFYLPVYLWGMGFNLAHISLLIGISGLSFCAALTAWQHSSRELTLKTLLCITFALEILLVVSTFMVGAGLSAIVVIAVANGLYNGFFWTTQRTLFLQLLGNNDSGKRYGNFQIFVTVFLKVGILVGGWLLGAGGLPWLLALSAIVGGVSSWWFYRHASLDALHRHPIISLKAALTFKDNRGSKPVFIVDGFFLFLESHYWTLSLFMLADENFAKLGFIVVLLALVFGVLFYLIKNTIDAYAVSLVFRVSVLLYAISWVARSFVTDSLSTQALMLMLLIVTFCSSFFRLAFNKRFFDIAQLTSGVGYLLIKSYLSQFYLGLGFIATSCTLWAVDATTMKALIPIYWVAALLSFSYLLYRRNEVPTKPQT